MTTAGRRGARLELRVSAAELAALQAVARDLGLSVSELLRLAAATMSAEYREGELVFDRRRSAHPVRDDRRANSGRRGYDAPVSVQTPEAAAHCEP